MRRILAGTTLAVLCGAAGLVRAGAEPAAAWPWSSWSELRLHARAGAFFTGRVEMGLDAHGVLTTESTASFLGATVSRSRAETRIDPETGRPRSHVRENRDYARRFLFERERYVVEKLVPPDGKRGTPMAEWEATQREEFPYRRDAAGAPIPAYDPYGVLLQLRRLPLARRGDEAVVHVATRRGAAPFRISVAEETETEVTIRDLGRDEKRTVSLRELRLRVVPDDPEFADEGFLELEGECEIWVEARTKTLVRINGKAPKVPGALRIALRAIE